MKYKQTTNFHFSSARSLFDVCGALKAVNRLKMYFSTLHLKGAWQVFISTFHNTVKASDEFTTRCVYLNIFRVLVGSADGNIKVRKKPSSAFKFSFTFCSREDSVCLFARIDELEFFVCATNCNAKVISFTLHSPGGVCWKSHHRWLFSCRKLETKGNLWVMNVSKQAAFTHLLTENKQVWWMAMLKKHLSRIHCTMEKVSLMKFSNSEHSSSRLENCFCSCRVVFRDDSTEMFSRCMTRRYWFSLWRNQQNISSCVGWRSTYIINDSARKNRLH